MPLNLPRRSPTNDFISVLRWAAKTAVWLTWHDELRETVEVSDWTAIGDFPNIRTGWGQFSQGQPPDWVWDYAGGQPAVKPSADHRRGFSLYLLGREGFEGARELCSTTGGVVAAIVELYDLYEAAPESQQGLLPIIQSAGSKLVETSFGQFHDPVLELIGWEKRPSTIALPVPPRPAPKPATTAVLPALANDLDDDITF